MLSPPQSVTVPSRRRQCLRVVNFQRLTLNFYKEQLRCTGGTGRCVFLHLVCCSVNNHCFFHNFCFVLRGHVTSVNIILSDHLTAAQDVMLQSFEAYYRYHQDNLQYANVDLQATRACGIINIQEHHVGGNSHSVCMLH